MLGGLEDCATLGVGETGVSPPGVVTPLYRYLSCSAFLAAVAAEAPPTDRKAVQSVCRRLQL